MEVISRLFNHKPSTQGEMVFYVNEFDKKMMTENAVLIQAENSSRSLLENTVSSCQSAIEKDLSQLNSKSKHKS